MTEVEEFKLLWQAYLRTLPEAEGRQGEPLTAGERALVEALAGGLAREGKLEHATNLLFENPAAMELLVAKLRKSLKQAPVGGEASP